MPKKGTTSKKGKSRVGWKEDYQRWRLFQCERKELLQ